MRTCNPESRILAATCLMLSFFASLTVRSNAAVIFSDVDPNVTSLFSLAEPIAGAFEDNNNNNTGFKAIHGWGRVVDIAVNGTLRSATLPFNVGSSAGLRIDVFQLPAVYLQGGRSDLVITTEMVHLGSSASLESLAGGRQWVVFSFADIPLVSGISYLFRASTDETLADPAAQSHYWLSSGAASGWIRDSRVVPSNSPVPLATFGDTRLAAGLAGSMYLTDVAVVPEPATVTMLLGASIFWAARRRRHC